MKNIILNFYIQQQIVIRGRFHKRFKSSFCVQKEKKVADDLTVFFALLGSSRVKALCKNVG